MRIRPSDPHDVLQTHAPDFRKDPYVVNVEAVRITGFQSTDQSIYWRFAPFALCRCRVRQACCPAASRISRVISSGREISDRWLAFTSMVLAPIRLAMKRSRSGLMVRSSVETA